MAGLAGRSTESDIAFATLQIAAKRDDGIATFPKLKKEIPSYVDLSHSDLEVSSTRPNERVWEQRIRNIKSHFDSPGNYLFEGYLIHVPRRGYQITPKGRRLLKSRGC